MQWLHTRMANIYRERDFRSTRDKAFYDNICDFTDFSHTDWNELRDAVMSVPFLPACIVQGLIDVKKTSAEKNVPAAEILIGLTEMTHVSLIRQAIHLSAYLPANIERPLNELSSHISIYSQSMGEKLSLYFFLNGTIVCGWIIQSI
jgi:hypothetical protein